MTISPTLQRYMADKGIQYDLIPHEPAMTSLGTAHAGHIPRDSMAKGVMLSDGQRYMLAVMPASHHLRLSDLKTELGQKLRLASEDEIVEVFRDCDRGAIPPVGSCYGLNVIIENDMDRQRDIYFEGGDHATLVHMKAEDFSRLNPQAQHGSFSEPMY
ncbi:aminoacyl-tRNA deacylase [Microvirga terrestris]|uniref:YbaK/EbsC family protein n=1 Tax=Microvirga terrestris TaxID=2791024 RepID=A0ABS0HQ34_9HYPH|nr:YbaK/EbsC family protein [Microvirga terrestris]MBF9195596.1 YbaK/EbsC family protein [Microvirga terrestris]